MKRGKLYPEQGQIGERVPVRRDTGAPPELSGRLHEPPGDRRPQMDDRRRAPRGAAQNPAYRPPRWRLPHRSSVPPRLPLPRPVAATPGRGGGGWGLPRPAGCDGPRRDVAVERRAGGRADRGGAASRGAGPPRDGRTGRAAPRILSNAAPTILPRRGARPERPAAESFLSAARHRMHRRGPAGAGAATAGVPARSADPASRARIRGRAAERMSVGTAGARAWARRRAGARAWARRRAGARRPLSVLVGPEDPRRGAGVADRERRLEVAEGHRQGAVREEAVDLERPLA